MISFFDMPGQGFYHILLDIFIILKCKFFTNRYRFFQLILIFGYTWIFGLMEIFLCLVAG